jgi:hypothetical protein
MPSPRFEVPAGLVNGINLVFTVSMPYGPGTTAVFLNGLLQERNLVDGWFETNPDAGIVTLKEAPRGSGHGPDVIQIFFIDRSPPLPEAACINLKGVIRLGNRRPLMGILAASAQIFGRISAQKPLEGHMDLRKDLRGSIVSHRLRATIRECV